MKKFDAQVVSVVEATPKVFLIRFNISLPFRPGQWIGLCSLAFLEHGTSRPLRRAFSVASLPGEQLELCIAKGLGLSKFLIESGVGTKVVIDGPYGSFWLRPAKQYVFVAGGTGIAPFRPMLHEALEKGVPTKLLFSIKSPVDFIYRKELESLKKKGLELVVTLTGETVSGFLHGRVLPLLTDISDDSTVYVCGPPQMVESVELELLKRIPRERLFVDKW